MLLILNKIIYNVYNFIEKLNYCYEIVKLYK
jgi:hypothetical protein